MLLEVPLVGAHGEQGQAGVSGGLQGAGGLLFPDLYSGYMGVFS